MIGLVQISNVFVKGISNIGFRVHNSIVLEHCCGLCFIGECALFGSFEISWRRERRVNRRPDWRRSERAGGVWVGGDCGIVLKLCVTASASPTRFAGISGSPEGA